MPAALEIFGFPRKSRGSHRRRPDRCPGSPDIRPRESVPGTTAPSAGWPFEVNQDDWMRFHTGAQEVCVSPSFGGLIRLTRCN